MLGLAQATGVAISNSTGLARLAVSEGETGAAEISRVNIRKICLAAAITGFSLSSIPCVIFATIPNQLSSILTGGQALSDDTLALAQSLLLINGLGLLLSLIHI